MFFSHTTKIQPDNSAAAQGTPGMDKKELIKEIIKKKITLIDYENIRDDLKSPLSWLWTFCWYRWVL